MTVALYNIDCLEFMRTMPAGSVDAVITDPPYGIGITHSPRISVSRGFDGNWDDAPASQEYINAVVFLGVPSVVWGGNYFVLPTSRCWLVWDKDNDGRDFAEAELAWTNLDAVVRVFRHRPQNMDGGKVHPTQKPLALMRWCIEMLTSPGATVFDPFMGSGTTGVACVQTGRNFIGIEIDPTYYAIAEKRIKEAQMQLRLEI